MIVFTVNEHKNICIAGLNRQTGYATVTEYKKYRNMFMCVFKISP